MKRILSLFLSAALVTTMTVPALAADRPIKDEGAYQSMMQSVASKPDEGWSNSALQAYIDTSFGLIPSSRSNVSSGDNLTGQAKKIYNGLIPQIKKIAAGEADALDIPLTIDKGVLNKDTYFKEVLVPAIEALMTDYPEHLYWFNKTGEDSEAPKNNRWGWGYFAYSMSTASGKVQELYLTMLVAEDYRLDGIPQKLDSAGYPTNPDFFRVDPKGPERIENAKDYARGIATYVNGLKDENGVSPTDAQKVAMFDFIICDETDYNFEAIQPNYTGYGDPWQLIYVFDEDPETKVVCEGYSKALQYLCDLSGINCYTITGKLVEKGQTEGGGHMWNQVRLGGKYYHVDVTNDDTNGDPDFEQPTLGSLVLLGKDDLQNIVSEAFSYTYDVPSEGTRLADTSYDINNGTDTSTPQKTVTITVNGGGVAYTAIPGLETPPAGATATFQAPIGSLVAVTATNERMVEGWTASSNFNTDWLATHMEDEKFPKSRTFFFEVPPVNKDGSAVSNLTFTVQYGAKIDVSNKISITGLDALTYDGKTKEGTAAFDPAIPGAAGAFKLTYAAAKQNPGMLKNGLPCGAGNYTVTASYSDNDRQGSKTAEFSIAQREITLKPADQTMTYGDKTLPELICTLTNGTLADDDSLDQLGLSATYLNGNGSAINPLSANADIYTIAVTAKGNSNYKVTMDATPAKLTINKKAAPTMKDLTKQVYTTAQDTVAVDLGAAGLPADRGVTTITVSDTTGTVVSNTPTMENGRLVFSSNGGAPDAESIITIIANMQNYENATISVTVKVVDKDWVEVTGVTVEEKTYDGKPAAPSGKAEADGYTGSFDYIYFSTDDGGYYGSAAPKDAGDYALVVSIPDSAEGVMGESVQLPFTINKAGLVLRSKDYSIKLGDTMPAPVLIADGLVAGDTLDGLNLPDFVRVFTIQDAEGNPLANTNTTGEYQIVLTSAQPVLTAKNYEITFGNGKLTITKKSSGGGGGGGSSSPIDNSQTVVVTPGAPQPPATDPSQAILPNVEAKPGQAVVQPGVLPEGTQTGPTGGVLLLDTKNYTMNPNGLYDISAVYAGPNTVMRVYSSQSSVATVTLLPNGRYRISGLAAGQTYIMFEVYDLNGNLINHASVKVVVDKAAAPGGQSNRNASLF